MQTKSFTRATVASVLLLFLGNVGVAQNSNAQPHCKPISGTVMTNLGAVDQSTTLGVVEGDLKGAVAASILNVAPGPGGTVTFSVQHHFVTESGDNILVDPATATTKEVAPGLFAVLNYPIHIKGGTGKFAGATGDLNNIGAAEFNADGTGRTVFRYSGQVCFAAPGNR